MNTSPQWAQLLTFFLAVAGARDVVMQFVAWRELPPNEELAAFQVWFGLVPAAIVGLLKGATAFVAWNVPSRTRACFLTMTLALVFAAFLRSPVGARLWHAWHEGPSVWTATTSADLVGSAWGMLAASAPYWGVTAFLFTGQRRAYFRDAGAS